MYILAYVWYGIVPYLSWVLINQNPNSEPHIPIHKL
jgi:hypothetical protein